MLASHALALVGVPMRRVIRLVQQQRDARYSLLRGYFRGADDADGDEGPQEQLRSLTLVPGAAAIGRTVGALEQSLSGVRILNLRRRDGKTAPAQPQAQVQEGDTLVLSGPPEALARAEELLLQP